MKTHIHSRVRSKKAALVAGLLVAVISSVASAERLNPAGPQEQARMEKSQPAPQEPSLIGEAKKLVRTGWRAIKSLWSDESPKVVQIPAKPRAPSNISMAPDTPSAAKPAVVAQPAAAPSAPASNAPNAPVAHKLQAPPGNISGDRGPVDQAGVQRTASGVQTYDISSATAIPRLKIAKEESLNRGAYALDTRFQALMDKNVIQSRESPELLGEAALKALVKMRMPRAGEVAKVKDFRLPAKGQVSRVAFDKIALNLKPEVVLKLAKVVPLTPEETRFLSGLLLYRQGGQCSTAIGLFHKLSKAKGWEAESNYYMAMCSKQLSLKNDFYERAARVLDTQDPHYAKKVLAEIDSDVPYEITDRFGNALLKVSSNAKIMEGLEASVMANIAYILGDFGISSERYKTALAWAKQVPESHPKYLKAQFLLSLAEYQSGSKEKALDIAAKIVGDPQTDKSRMEFQALVALNAARMYFQEQNFKSAFDNFHKVYKDHPLWLQSLTELGWAQLMSGDYEGAIGNMYSIHSPFFTSVYKPESYVIRTIGYLSLCQYGDAYKALSILEHDYRPYLQKIEAYLAHAKANPSYYQTVRNFLGAGKGVSEVDGLPLPVIREMARHRDFINLQKALNRQIDERPNYAKMNNEVEKQLKKAQDAVSDTRKQADRLRKLMAQARSKKNNRQQVALIDRDLDDTLAKLNSQFFYVDLYTEAKAGMDDYRREVIGGADNRIADMRGRIEKVLSNRLLRMKVELARMLDNNELLRYEVFAGSGENLRYQVAGGETGKRVPANVMPKSKSLQWDFDGEYWEDEIGHYRSSLKNNCPEKQHAQASLEGGVK